MLKGNTDIAVFQTTSEAAHAAANAVAGEIRRSLAKNGHASAIFDGFSLPVAFFDSLIQMPDIDWTQVIVFQAGEYLGEDRQASSSAQRFLTDHLVLRVPIVSFHPMRGDAANPRAAAANYSARLTASPPDFALLGFDFLSVEGPPVEQDHKVGVIIVGGRRAAALTPAAIGGFPKLFALGQGPAPLAARRHSNSEIFVAVNP
ncbi:MAG: 6-phosphogluconolactonase [Acidobacteriota bacterium]